MQTAGAKEKNLSALSQTLQTPLYEVDAANLIHQTYLQQKQDMPTASALGNYRIDMSQTTHTEHVMSQLGASQDLAQLHIP